VYRTFELRMGYAWCNLTVALVYVAIARLYLEEE
jgi:hypothetical protein